MQLSNLEDSHQRGRLCSPRPQRVSDTIKGPRHSAGASLR
jgi:hypothetical protein